MFYTIRQNNSGGYLLENDKLGIGEFIVIEEECSEQAKERFEAIRESYGNGFDVSCECCGRRWYENLYDEDATDTPDCPNDAFVHYLDDRIIKGGALDNVD